MILSFFLKKIRVVQQLRMQPGCPISLEKIIYEPFHGKVLFKTPKYNEYFKENFKSFDALDFIAAVTARCNPKDCHHISL